MNLKFLAKLQDITSTFFNKIMILQADNNMIFFLHKYVVYFEYGEFYAIKI